MVQCNFQKAWIGQCKNDSDESGYCEEHKGIKCCSCGSQATHSCDETGGLACGAMLCDECTHNTHPEGHNGLLHKWPDGMKRHCKRSEQKYAPWYIDESNIDKWKELNDVPSDSKIILTNKR